MKRYHFTKLLALLFFFNGSSPIFGRDNSKDGNKKPNILWLICEDISPYFSFYGDSTAQTPNLDKLADESMVFTKCYTTVGVCAPSRASLITGMYPISIGTQNQRTAMDAMGWGNRKYGLKHILGAAHDIEGSSVREYSAVVPDYVRCFTEYLRAEGWYCTNNYKTDYNFAAPVTAWDENSIKASWENRPPDKPFFSVFTDLITHESQIWGRRRLPLSVDPDSVPLPSYFPDDSLVRNDIARLYTNIESLDDRFGKIIQTLKDQGLYDNTIIFFFSDNGGPMPRGKRETLETGLHVPFLVRFPDGLNAGKIEGLVSFVDFAPTVLSLAGIKPPKYMQGQAFLGKYKSDSPRKYIFGSGDRFDEYPDKVRAVIDERYLFVKNDYPQLPPYKDVSYRKVMPMMKRLLIMRDEGKLSGVAASWFQPHKSGQEELYDCIKDPDNVNNLINASLYEDKIKELRIVLEQWLKDVGDMGNIPETKMIEQMWPDNIQPITMQPQISIAKGNIKLTCNTIGSSIAYILSDEKIVTDLDSGWKLYHELIEPENAKYLYVMSNRIGFADSDVIEIKLEERTN